MRDLPYATGGNPTDTLPAVLEVAERHELRIALGHHGYVGYCICGLFVRWAPIGMVETVGPAYRAHLDE